jgi:hypothetical protein
MRSKLIASFLMLTAILLPLASASFEAGNHSIEEIYGLGDNLKGWLNLSFQDEPGDSIIEASSGFSGSISLMGFLDVNRAYYECEPADCENDYSVSNAQDSKDFSLNYDEERIYGLVLEGSNIRVTNLSFNVFVNNKQTCENPLEIDLLDDDIVEWKSKIVGDNFECKYKEGTGCFNRSEQLSEVSIGNIPFCEKIKLSPTNKFKVGAWVKKRDTTWYNGLLVMSLYDLDNTELVNCELPEPSPSGGEISCEIEYENPELKDYYVCINAEEQTDYIIKVESKESCGFYAYPGQQDEYHDYYIFATGARFSNIGSFSFNQQKYEEQGFNEDLADYVDSYVDYKYDRNCTNKCIIPIKFKSYGSSDVKISNLNLEYSTGAGPSATPETKIYDTSREAAKLTTNFIELDLSLANITAPEDYGEYDLMLYLGGEELLEEEVEIVVEKVLIIRGVFPKVVSAVVPTRFVADVEHPGNKSIVSYTWDFGDGETKTSLENKVTHTYNLTGTYILSLEVEDEAGFISSKSFDIEVRSPKELVNSTIAEYKNRLENLSSQLALMPSWYKEGLKETIGMGELSDKLKVLERKKGLETTSGNYVKIMSDLLNLRIPRTIKMSSQGEMLFFVDDIKPEHFEKLGAGSCNVENCKESIAAWSQEFLNVSLNFKYILAYYDEAIENMASVFDLKIKSKKKIDRLYIVIEEPDIILKQDYKVKEFDGVSGVKLQNVLDKDIEFAVLREISIDELKIYLSPDFAELLVTKIEPCNFNGRCEEELEENWRNCRADCKPWGIASAILIVLIFSALVAYILLQWWYKYKYENYLFKNKNDIYNLLQFIRNAESQGLSERDIVSKLKKTGWNREQISYVFKKYRGKAIMPLDFLKLFKSSERVKLKRSQPPGKFVGKSDDKNL